MTIEHTQLIHIDQWLAAGDGKRAEVQIARLLRGELPPGERAQLLIRRARARLLTARPEEALEDLQTSRALAPVLWEQAEAQELLADSYFSRFEGAHFGFAERADTDRAREIYESIAERYPLYANLGWVMYQWGRVLLSENKVDEAAQKFQEALLKPSSVPTLTALCYERLGFIYLVDRRDPAMALSFFSRAASTYPAGQPAGWLVRLHLLRSRAFRDQNRYDLALQAAEIALASVNSAEHDYRSTLTDAHLALGEILASIPGREREATEHLVQFLQHSRRPQGVDVTWSRVHETLGDLWFRLDRYENAVEAYHTALEFNPYHPWEIVLHYQIARSHYRLREYEKAISTVEHMLKLAQAEQQPITDYRVFGVLANAHFALEHYAEASAAYERAVELAPPQAENLDKLKTYLKFAQELAQRR
jgi:tetratricopeptide (TPR) repeat protein